MLLKKGFFVVFFFSFDFIKPPTGTPRLLLLPSPNSWGHTPCHVHRCFPVHAILLLLPVIVTIPFHHPTSLPRVSSESSLPAKANGPARESGSEQGRSMKLKLWEGGRLKEEADCGGGGEPRSPCHTMSSNLFACVSGEGSLWDMHLTPRQHVWLTAG